MAVTIQTGGGTTPASSLWPFYDKKEVIKTFIMVTDEEENGDYHGYRFVHFNFILHFQHYGKSY